MTENRATRTTVSTFAILVGLAAAEHGFFEVLQGSLRPRGVLIQAIGPAQRFWEYGTETALTVVPSFLISGILSMIVGLLMILGSLAFVRRRYGAAVLFLLGVISFLVGGGFAPIFLTVLIGVAALGVNRPLRFGSRLQSPRLKRFVTTLWKVSLVALVILYAVAVEIAIFGYPLRWLFDAETSMSILNACAYLMVALMLLSVLGAFAVDAQGRGEARRQRREER
jgi:hypothetical protein